MDRGKFRILILDDDDIIRESLKDYLEDEGFSVKGFADGEDALDYLKTESFNIAIVDMRLPGIDGNSFILKASKVSKDMKFIIHTGSSNYSLTDDIADLGISEEHIYIKPVGDMGLIVNGILKIAG